MLDCFFIPLSPYLLILRTRSWNRLIMEKEWIRLTTDYTDSHRFINLIISKIESVSICVICGELIHNRKERHLFNFWFALTINKIKTCLYRQCRPKSYVLKQWKIFQYCRPKSIYLWIVVESATGKNTLSEDLLKEW